MQASAGVPRGEQARRQLSPGRDDHGGTRPGQGAAPRIALGYADKLASSTSRSGRSVRAR